MTDTNSTTETEVPVNPEIILDYGLLQALQLPKDRTFILRTEILVNKFIKDKTQYELEFPPLNSYYRRLVHRIGRYYGLEHRVFGVERLLMLRKGVIGRSHTRPILFLADLVGPVEDNESGILVKKETSKSSITPSNTITSSSISSTIDGSNTTSVASSPSPSEPCTSESTIPLAGVPKILRRAGSKTPITQESLETNNNNNNNNNNGGDSCNTNSSIFTSVSGPVASDEILLKRLADREEEYQRARERIFKDFVPEPEPEPAVLSVPELIVEQVNTTDNNLVNSGNAVILNPLARPFEPVPIVNIEEETDGINEITQSLSTTEILAKDVEEEEAIQLKHIILIFKTSVNDSVEFTAEYLRMIDTEFQLFSLEKCKLRFPSRSQRQQQQQQGNNNSSEWSLAVFNSMGAAERPLEDEIRKWWQSRGILITEFKPHFYPENQ